eukprot:m.351724 g.351724  ORF g.351724 m.351724 type:complete len:255 (+) comp16330_c0_seq1:41-805(+)
MASDKSEETKGCMGRTKNQWVKLLVFYLFFYAWLCALFAICLIVMQKTLPDVDANVGPKLKSELVFPTAAVYPASIRVSRVDWAAFADEEEKSLLGFYNATQDGRINIDPAADFGPCNELVQNGSLTNNLYAGKPCVFVQLTRVFGQPTQNVDASLSLEFPTPPEFVKTFGVPTSSVFPTVSSPATVAATPFMGSSDYQDIIVAFQIDLTALVDVDDNGFNIQILMDYGQAEPDERTGVAILPVDVNEDVPSKE